MRLEESVYIFYQTGMGTRRKSSRPRRWRHQLRQDRDETFVALETWSRR